MRQSNLQVNALPTITHVNAKITTMYAHGRPRLLACLKKLSKTIADKPATATVRRPPRR